MDRLPDSAALQHWSLARLKEYAGNPRKNDQAVDAAAKAIATFGFRVPILAKSDGLIVDGHLRLKAARQLGLETVPVLLADDLTEAQVKAFRLSVNKIAELAEWDQDLLAFELDGLRDADFDIASIGFAPGELTGTPNTGPPAAAGIEYQEKFAVLVECAGETEQAEIYERLVGLGLTCKVLVN